MLPTMSFLQPVVSYDYYDGVTVVDTYAEAGGYREVSDGGPQGGYSVFETSYDINNFSLQEQHVAGSFDLYELGGGASLQVESLQVESLQVESFGYNEQVRSADYDPFWGHSVYDERTAVQALSIEETMTELTKVTYRDGDGNGFVTSELILQRETFDIELVDTNVMVIDDGPFGDFVAVEDHHREVVTETSELNVIREATFFDGDGVVATTSERFGMAKSHTSVEESDFSLVASEDSGLPPVPGAPPPMPTVDDGMLIAA